MTHMTFENEKEVKQERDKSKDIFFSLEKSVKKPKPNKRRYVSWMDDEIKILKERYSQLGAIGIHSLLSKHSISSIQGKAFKLGLKFCFVNIWIDDEIGILKKHYPELGATKEMQDLLPRHDASSIGCKAFNLGIKSEVNHYGGGGGPKDPEKRELWKKRQSESQIRRYEDPEERKKTGILTAKRFENNPEERKEQSIKSIKYWLDPKTREEASIRSTKKWSDPEFREKTAKAVKIGKNIPEAIKRASESQVRRYIDHPEEREKVSVRITEAWTRNPKRREEQSIWSTKWWSDSKRREEQSKISNEYWSDPKTREDQSIRSIKYYSDPVLGTIRREKNRADLIKQISDPNSAILRNRKNRDTRPERLLWKIMDELGFKYEKQHHILHYHADIFVAPNFVFEADGCYIHGCSEHFPYSYRADPERDRLRDENLIFAGFIVTRFWEHDLKERPVWVKEYIRDILGLSNYVSVEVPKIIMTEKVEQIATLKNPVTMALQRAYHRESSQEYYQSHKEEIKADRKEYYQIHKEEIKVKDSEYRQIHKEEIKARRSEYYKNHKERIIIRCREYYQSHKKERKARDNKKKRSTEVK